VNNRTMPPLPRATMAPETFYARCPGCLRPHHLDGCDWEEQDNGSYAAVPEARFPLCEYCDLQFEIAPVWIKEVTP